MQLETLTLVSHVLTCTIRGEAVGKQSTLLGNKGSTDTSGERVGCDTGAKSESE